VFRLAMLGSHYRQPIDWTVERLLQAKSALMEFTGLVQGVPAADAPQEDVLAALSDDLNTPSAISILHGLAKSAKRGNAEIAGQLKASLAFLGLHGGEAPADFDLGRSAVEVDTAKVDELIAARLAARKAKDFKESDRIRDSLAAMGVTLKDGKDAKTGAAVTTWEVGR
jgi:cysteinyl-tRNA synthetase